MENPLWRIRVPGPAGDIPRTRTEVAIDGRVYSLAGGDADYLKRVGAYVDEKIAELKKSGVYSSQTTEYRNVLVYLNLADDYMREHEEAGKLKKRKMTRKSTGMRSIP